MICEYSALTIPPDPSANAPGKNPTRAQSVHSGVCRRTRLKNQPRIARALGRDLLPHVQRNHGQPGSQDCPAAPKQPQNSTPGQGFTGKMKALHPYM